MPFSFFWVLYPIIGIFGGGVSLKGRDILCLVNPLTPKFNIKAADLIERHIADTSLIMLLFKSPGIKASLCLQEKQQIQSFQEDGGTYDPNLQSRKPQSQPPTQVLG